MKTYYGVDFQKQREALLNSEVAKPLIENLIIKADAALDKSYEALKMSEYILFYETGNRSIFERKYFERRNNCSYLSIALWLTEDEKYIKPLVDAVFNICDEFTWCLPAHVLLDRKPSVEEMIEHIDLFMSETARLLTDIIAAVGDKLPYYVTQRVEYEIRRRVIVPMLKPGGIWWQETTTNWSAVCSGGCTVAVLHFGTKEECDKVLPLLYNGIEAFLSGINDDGCCMEGYSYWNYGFGYFLIFARAILDYTGGKVNYFEREKVKQIALYPQKIRMGKTRNACFSDGSASFSFSPGCMSFLKAVYGDEFLLPDLELATMKGNVYSLKEFLWLDTEYKADEAKNMTNFFDEAQWFIKQGEKFSFAAKGGDNDEPHNHNDIGSFMIVADEQIPLDDFGAAEYVKGTFDNKIRYTLIVNGSHGHSLPIINGKYQCYGKEFKASNVKAEENTFSLDIEGAYEDGLINKIHRSFEITENTVVLKDTFDYSDKTESIIERMVTHVEPEIKEGYVNLQTAKVVFDASRYSASYTKEVYRDHGNRGDATAYLIDFKPQNDKETVFEFEIEIL